MEMSQYPDNWKDIADRIKALNGWRCERCGHPHETPSNKADCDDKCSHEQNGKQRVLTVHHLDGNKGNCSDWNLAALCQVCHLQIQAKVNMRQGWLYEHSEWMQPHIEALNEHGEIEGE